MKELDNIEIAAVNGGSLPGDLGFYFSHGSPISSGPANIPFINSGDPVANYRWNLALNRFLASGPFLTISDFKDLAA